MFYVERLTIRFPRKAGSRMVVGMSDWLDNLIPDSFVEVNLDEVTGRLREIPAEQLPERVGPVRAREEIKTRIRALQWGLGLKDNSNSQTEEDLANRLWPGTRYRTPSPEVLRMWMRRLRHWEECWNASHPGLDCRVTLSD